MAPSLKSLVARITGGGLRQRWPKKPGPVRYRVTVRDAETQSTIGILRGIRRSSCTLPREWLASGKVEVRVDAKQGSQAGQYVTWLPFFVPTSCEIKGQSIRAPFDAQGFPIRLVVRALDGDRVLFDEARIDGQFNLPEGTAGRYKFMRFDTNAQRWLDVGRYQRLAGAQPSHIQLMPSPWRKPLAPVRSAPFLFTVDVEVNLRYQRVPNRAKAVDEHVFGITPGGDGKEYGVRYLMNALERHGMKGTFFIDVLMQYQVGESELKRVIESIQSRGHDIQLHLHPNPNLYYAEDPTLQRLGLEYGRTRSPASFRRSLELGCEIFTRTVGRAPLAFRNGSYALTDEFLDVLPEFGIRFDSSLYAFKNASVSPWLMGRSTAFRHASGIIELPVTWVVLRHGRVTRVRQHALHLGSDAARTDDAIRALWSVGSAPIVMVTHSFSLLRDLRDGPVSDTRLWNEHLKTNVDERLYGLLRLDEKQPKLTMEGPHPDRVSALETRLALVAASRGAKAMTFTDLAGLPEEDLFLDAATDPVVEVNAEDGHSQVTGLRRYSRSYLQYLDSHG